MRIMMRPPPGPHGDYSVSVTDFIFTAPRNEPASILCLNQYFSLSQISFCHSLRLFRILSFKEKKVYSLVSCDSLPLLPKTVKWAEYSRKNRKIEVSNSSLTVPYYPLFVENTLFFFFSFIIRGNVEINTICDRIPSHGLNLLRCTIFLIWPSLKAAALEWISLNYTCVHESLWRVSMFN